jgi:hypothetical protein
MKTGTMRDTDPAPRQISTTSSLRQGVLSRECARLRFAVQHVSFERFIRNLQKFLLRQLREQGSKVFFGDALHLPAERQFLHYVVDVDVVGHFRHLTRHQPRAITPAKRPQ